MRHPFEFIPTSCKGKYFWIFLIFTLLITIVLYVVGKPLITEAAPLGIVSYELAGKPAQSQVILDSWNGKAEMNAAFSLGFDYLYMVVYAVTISLACVWAADLLSGSRLRINKVGPLLAWGAYLAALFDALENLALTILLFGSVISPWPEIARMCALFKFGLILLGIVYGLFGLIWGSLLRLARQR